MCPANDSFGSDGGRTFRNAPLLAEKIKDAELLRSIYEVAAEISRRSAKHSADFLNAAAGRHGQTSEKTPTDRLAAGYTARRGRYGAVSSPPLNADELTRAAIDLASAFAERAGGIGA